jgi:hypothetical protein
MTVSQLFDPFEQDLADGRTGIGRARIDAGRNKPFRKAACLQVRFQLRKIVLRVFFSAVHKPPPPAVALATSGRLYHNLSAN